MPLKVEFQFDFGRPIEALGPNALDDPDLLMPLSSVA